MDSVITLLQQCTPRQSHQHPCKPTPLFSLVSQLQASLREFCRSDHKTTWLEFLYKTKKNHSFSTLLRRRVDIQSRGSCTVHRACNASC